jgi:Cu(I)/Ag(I) efflux system membrane fusion protein
MNKVRIAIMISIIAAISFWIGAHFNKSRSTGPEERGARTVLYYTDPMNPGFRSDKPGTAPCGMPLEPVYAEEDGGPEDSAGSRSPGAVKIDAYRRQLVGVKTAAVQATPMTYTLRLYGKVVPDETRVYRVNASTDSWIRQISNVTTGSFVRRGQILAEALAPAYYNAQVTYLIALDNMDRIQQQLGGQLRHQQGDLANNQVRVSVQALQNLGIGDDQVEELANKRQARPYLQIRAPTRGIVLKRNITLNQWFKAAEEFYTIADIRHVWIYADVYENEARHLRPGMEVQVRHAQLGKTFDASVSEVLPLFDPVSKTLKVRLDVENPFYELRPDMFVDVEIPISLPPSLNVPADAVIDSGTRTIVYVETGNGVFEPRRVETGWRLGRRIEIIGGLMPEERVVVSGNFLIDSESRMKTAAAVPEVRKSKDPLCGMDVDEETAETEGRTVKFAGRTFYFCSIGCMKRFTESPRQYAEKGRSSLPSDAMQGNQGWMEMDSPANGGHHKIHAAPGPAKEENNNHGKRPTTAGVIDWSGPGSGNDAPKDWSGWGKFPGAEYLGLKHRAKTTAVKQQNAPAGETIIEQAPEGSSREQDPGMNHEPADGKAQDSQGGHQAHD